MRRSYPVVVAALCMLCTACSVVRKLPEGSYLVQKVTIEDDRSVPKNERITASELDRYVWQSPNKRFLGINFYAWVYNQANPDKDNWWNRFKRKIGQKPVIYDPALTLKSAENLKAYMESHGFFSSSPPLEKVCMTKYTRQHSGINITTGKIYFGCLKLILVIIVLFK